MYKLIAIDLDDTLLTDDLTVTEGTKKALKEAMNQGVIVTLATGRMYASAKKITNQIGLHVPLITYHGSLVKNLVDERVLYEKKIPIEVSTYLYQFCLERNLHLQFFIDDQVIVREKNSIIMEYSALTGIDYHVEPDPALLLSKPNTKMIIIDKRTDYLDQIAEELKQHLGSQVHITKSKPTYLEIIHTEGTKGDALRFLAQHFDCDLSEVIAIGDSWNDREMIEAAGLGVAMGNAIDSLKEIADYITLSNNEEGVKHVVDTFILNQPDAE